MGAVEILNLRQAFDEKQSNAIAQFFDANAASKRDIEELHLEIEKVRAETAQVRVEVEKVRAEIEKVRAELKVDIAEVRGEVEKVRSEVEKVRAELSDKMLRYQIGGVVSVGLIIALVRVFA